MTLEDLKNAVKNSNLYALQDGRYYVALSLAEAESLRAAVHAARRDVEDGAGDGTIVPFSGAELGLRLAAPGGGGALLEATGGYRPAELFQAATATQCFRFVDSQMDFEDHEASLLLRALQSSPREHRADFFERVRAVRRRARAVAKHDAGARAHHRGRVRASRVARHVGARARAALRRHKMRLLDAFPRPSTANSSDDSRTRRCTGVSRGSGWTSPRAR